GGGGGGGGVLVQARRPEQGSLVAAARHDYASFMAGELERRRVLGYPPFARLVLLRLEGRDESRVENAARRLAERLRGQARTLDAGDDAVLRPAPPPVAPLRRRRRRPIPLRPAQ